MTTSESSEVGKVVSGLVDAVVGRGKQADADCSFEDVRLVNFTHTSLLFGGDSLEEYFFPSMSEQPHLNSPVILLDEELHLKHQHHQYQPPVGGKRESHPLEFESASSTNEAGRRAFADSNVVIGDAFISESISIDPQQGIDPFSSQDNWHTNGPLPCGQSSVAAMDHQNSAGMVAFGGSEGIQMWQQSNYILAPASGATDPCMTESGFISGTNTGPSSPSGHDDVDADGNYVGSVSGSTLYNLDYLPQSELSSVASSQNIAPFDPDESIPKLLANLIDEDPVVVNESLKSLECYISHSKQFKDTIITHRLSDDLSRCLSTKLMQATEILASTQNPPQEKVDQAKSTSKILSTLSSLTERCPAIIESGAVSAFATLLNSSDNRLRIYACTNVHNIVYTMDTAPCDDREQQLRTRALDTLRGDVISGDVNGVSALCSVLQCANCDGNEKLMTIAVDCLRVLSIGHASTKLQLLEFQIPQLLVAILGSDLDERLNRNLIYCTLRLLKVLSTCVRNKVEIIKAGGIGAMSKYLSCSKEKILNQCACTLRNLSDTMHKQMLEGKLSPNHPDVIYMMRQLVRLLGHKEQDVFTVAADILCNLTLNNTCKLEMCKADGITYLLNILNTWELQTNTLSAKKTKDLLTSIVRTLKHITSGHDMREEARRTLLSTSNSVEPLMNLLDCLTRTHSHQPNGCPVHINNTLLGGGLDNGSYIVAPGGGRMRTNGNGGSSSQQHPYNFGLVREILLLILNLASSPARHNQLQTHGIFATIADFTAFIKRNFLDSQGKDVAPALEICLDILNLAAQHPATRQTDLAKPQLVDLLREFMQMPSESFQCRALSLVHKLSVDPGCGFIIKSSQATVDALQQFAASNRDSIAHEAKEAIHFLKNPPPPDPVLTEPPLPQQQTIEGALQPACHHLLQQLHKSPSHGDLHLQSEAAPVYNIMQSQGPLPHVQQHHHPAPGFNGNQPAMESYQPNPLQPTRVASGPPQPLNNSSDYSTGHPADFHPATTVNPGDSGEVQFLEAMGASAPGNFDRQRDDGDFFNDSMM